MKIDIEATIEISVQHYRELLEDSKFLAKLYANGVDCWEGYDQCQEDEGEQYGGC